MKKDNRGVSLVELLAAMIILALVVAPMLQSFLVSMKLNNKARNTMRATTVAQNLMERLSAFQLEEICEQFNLEENFKIYPQNNPDVTMYHEEMAEADGSKSGIVEEDAQGNSKFIFKGKQSNQYVFLLQNMEEDDRIYDAKITLDATGYRKEAGNPESEKTSYNDDYSFEVTKMDSLTDAVLFWGTNQEENAYKTFIQEKGITLTSEELAKNVKRTMELTFEKYEGDGEQYRNGTTIRVRITYEYGGKSYTDDQAVLYPVREVKNVYLMYTPNYHSTSDSMAEDKIIIHTNGSQEYYCYLIKQRISEKYRTKYYGEKDLSLLDEAYRANIEIKDDSGAVDTEEFVSSVHFRTNLNSNITESKNQKTLNAYTLKYFLENRELFTYPQSLSNEKAEKVLGMVEQKLQGLAGEIRNDNVIYDTVIEIFPQGTIESGIENLTEKNRLAVMNRKQNGL